MPLYAVHVHIQTGAPLSGVLCPDGIKQAYQDKHSNTLINPEMLTGRKFELQQTADLALKLNIF